MQNVAPMPRRWKTIRELISLSLIFLILTLPIALSLGMIIGQLSPIYSVVVSGVLVIVIMLLLRLDEFIVALIVAVHIFVDSYLGFDTYQVALILGLVLLFVCSIGRSDDHPFTGPRSIWFWILFLIMNIYPTINGGAFKLTNSIAFYLNLALSAFIIFWLGNIIARDISAVRRVFQLLSILAAFIAIHTIIQATTGKFLFQTSYAATSLIKYSNFQTMGAAGTTRAGSFLINPDNNGNFLAPCFFLALGLFIESKQLWAKMIYILETLLILLALMFTYSTASWVAVLIGIVVLMFIMGRIRHSMLLLLLIVMLTVIAFTVFPSQISAQLGHANNQSDLSDHLGTMQTAIRVIEAYPLFGVGLGDQAYLNRANPYLSLAQHRPQGEPDNSYLQWGAISGIPVMLVFLLLLGSVFWFSWRNWRAIPIHYRPLLGGGIVALIALSINSLTNDGWTDPSGIAILGWLIAGLLTSPFIGNEQHQQSGFAVAEIAEIVHDQPETSRMNVAERGLRHE